MAGIKGNKSVFAVRDEALLPPDYLVLGRKAVP